MTAPQIQVDVSPAGETQLLTSGFAGQHCQEASRFLEQALGQKTSESLTSEYYQSLTTLQQNQLLKEPP